MNMPTSIFSLEYLVWMLKDWPFGTLLGVVIIILTMLLLCLIFYGLFVAVDLCYQSVEDGNGKVVSKKFSPAHTSTIVIHNSTTKTSTPHIIHHSDSWSLVVEVLGQRDSISVAHSFYDSISEGDIVRVKYSLGRFSGQLYIKEVFILNQDIKKGR